MNAYTEYVANDEHWAGYGRSRGLHTHEITIVKQSFASFDQNDKVCHKYPEIVSVSSEHVQNIEELVSMTTSQFPRAHPEEQHRQPSDQTITYTQFEF